ncbi:hypothetical protein CR513_46603, partial [Mucuna pruriens]
RTFHRLIRSPRSSEVANNNHNGSAFASDSTVLKSDNADFDYDPTNSNFDLGVYISKFSLDNMVDNYMTLKELATPDIIYQPYFISEDPHKQLKEFHGSTQQFGVGEFATSRVVNELAIGHHISPLVRVCGICASIEHPTDMCPILKETKLNSVEVTTMMGGQQYR